MLHEDLIKEYYEDHNRSETIRWVMKYGYKKRDAIDIVSRAIDNMETKPF